MEGQGEKLKKEKAAREEKKDTETKEGRKKRGDL
jgi:hypothetical protein